MRLNTRNPFRTNGAGWYRIVWGRYNVPVHKDNNGVVESYSGACTQGWVPEDCPTDTASLPIMSIDEAQKGLRTSLSGTISLREIYTTFLGEPA